MDNHQELNTKRGWNNKSICIKHFTKLLTLIMCSNFLACGPCNSFPKIFGANGGRTYLSQIDVYSDYLAIGGHTKDNTLTGSTSQLPYVAVMSVSTGSYFYWAKALSAKLSQTIAGIQFSADGVLLIAHSGLLEPGFILVFNGATGAVVTSRAYFTSSYNNYDARIKSLLVSSGASPMAYVLSKYQTSLTCSTQHFLKFNPLTFSASPVWAKKTLASTSMDDCSNLGLAFGRGENFLYAFSWYNSKSTISLLDTNGLAYWQYANGDGHSIYNNLIQYKAIDASTDMVIATSGEFYIFYSRIISSSASPYLIQTGSQTYYDPNFSSKRKIRALFISSLTSAKSLIYDSFYGWTDLASIDFSTTPKITYKKTLPYMDVLAFGMTTGLFTSDTVYYTGTYSDWFYQSLSTTYKKFNTNVFFQAVVYTSDMTKSTCYSLSTATSQTPITMLVLPLTSIKATIYQSSSVKFVADSAASTTVNIVQSMITSITSWCPQQAFTVIPVTQAKTTFSFNTMVAVQNLGITLYSATVGCGTLPNVWTYTGFDFTTGLALTAADLISVDPNSGVIQVQMTKPAGMYKVKVLGTLTDLKTTDYYVFTINIGAGGNQIPYFITPLVDQSIPLNGGIKTYTFPALTDPDAGDTLSITSVYDQASTSSPLAPPSFTSFSVNTLTMTPTSMSHVKVYTIIVVYTDGHVNSQSQFILTVTNLAPIVSSTIPTSLPLTFGQDLTYNLPTSSDPENLPYTTTILSGPSYVTILSNTQARIFPQNCQTDLGNVDLYLKLEDQEPKSFTYSITLKVPNSPPVFTGGQPQNQTMMYNTYFAYTLPTYQDPEGCPVVLTYQPTTLSSFVSISGNQIVFQPKQLFQVGNFDIMVILTDYQGLSMNTTFGMLIYQPPQFIGSVVKQIELMASNEAYYSLPIMVGIGGEYVIHESSLPRFVQFNFPDYTFLPNRISDLGVYTIKGQLWNAYTYISFQFRLNVTNEAPYLMGAQMPDQIVVALNTIEYYLLPSALDRESQPITYLTYQTKKSSLPAFISFNTSSKEFIIAPNSLDIVDRYPITIDIIDSFNAMSSYSFVISLYDTSGFLQAKQNITSTQTSMKNVTIPKANLNKTEVQLAFLKIVIVKVTREQEVTMKIQSTENLNGGISQIVKQITNRSLSITVIQKNNSYPIPFSIVSKDTTTYQIKLGLKYPNPSNLSNSQIPDKIQIVNLQRLQVLQKTRQIVMLENIEASAEIPPQLTEDVEQAVASYLQGGRLTFTQSTPVNIVLGFLVQILWSQLEDFSFLTINSMISIQIPGIPSIIQAVLIKFIYFDILYTELWMPQFMTQIGLDFDDVQNDDAVSIVFSDNGFQSKQFLKNAGSTFFYLIIYLAGWIVLFMLQRISALWSAIIPLKEKLEGVMMWNQSLNLLQSQFTPLMMCSIINLYDMRMKNDQKVSEVSAYFALGVFIIIMIALLVVFMKVWRLKKTLNEKSIEEFNSKYSKLTESLKQTKIDQLVFLWRPLNLARWLLTVTILVVFKNEPEIQMMLLLILSLIQQGLILKSQPFETKLINRLSLFNEAAVSIFLYLTLSLTDYLDTQITQNDQLKSKIRLQISWLLSVLLLLTILLNFLVTYGQLFSQIYRYLKRCIQKRYKLYNINQTNTTTQVVRLQPEKRINQALNQKSLVTQVLESRLNSEEGALTAQPKRLSPEEFVMREEIVRSRKQIMKMGTEISYHTKEPPPAWGDTFNKMFEMQ